MFCYPYARMINNYYRSRQADSYIRFFNASPDASAVDIYVNNNPFVKDLDYKEFSQYYPLSSGVYNIKVFPSGQMENPVIDTSVNIAENTIFNLTVTGTLPDVSLYSVQEPASAQNFGRPCIRFVHLSPNAPTVDIKFSDGARIFNSISYKGITDYLCLPAGTYTFTVSPAGTENIVLTVPDVKLDANNYYTMYAVGEAGGSPALEVIVETEPR